MDHLLLVPLLTGPLFLVVGLILWKRPPARINMTSGYRTRASMASQERWDFAQRHAARGSLRLGAALLASSLIGVVVPLNNWLNTGLGMALLFVGIGIMIGSTERALKRRFGPL